MPRLLSEEGVRASQAEAAAHLEELWGALHSRETSDAVFRDAESTIQASLSPWGRIHIVEALLRYCGRVEEAQNEREAVEEVIEQAKRLVGRVRREIVDLKRSRDAYEQQLASTPARHRARPRNLAAETGRECAALFLSIKDAVGELEILAGFAFSSPHERLAGPTTKVWEAAWELQPPFRHAHCEKALSILDDLLNDWAVQTRSRKGQSWESKALNDLIDDLGKVLRGTSGTPVVDASDRFNPFLKRLLVALPAEFAKYYERGEEALAKRSRRVRSKNVTLVAAN